MKNQIVNRNDNRQRIIQAAVSLFAGTHDIKKVSLETIARKANVSPTTIYNKFGTREALLVEAIKVLLRETLDRNRELIRSNMPFPQKIASVISGKLEMTSHLSAEIIAKIMSQDKSIAPFIEKLYESEIKPLWKEMLADGKRQGYIDPGIDDEVLLIYLDILKAGFSTKRELLQRLTESKELLEKLTRIVFFGFLKKDFDLFNKEEKVKDG